ncbi:MAG: type IV secretion system protein [Candidatus Adiutrix sp.]
MGKDESFPLKTTALALFVFLLFFALSGIAEAENLGTSTMDKFVARTTPWWDTLKGYSLTIFKAAVGIDIAFFGVKMALQRSDIAETLGQFAMLMIYALFILGFIHNYESWTKAIALDGLKPIIGALPTGDVTFDIGQPVALMFKILEGMVPVLSDAGIRDIPMTMLYVFCMATIVVIFAIMVCRYIIVVCEFHIVANVGVLLVALGGSKFFKEYAMNVMRYIFSIAVKLFVLQLIMTLGFSILALSDATNLQGQSIKLIKVGDLLSIIIQGAILLALAMSLPTTCAGIISGANIDGGNPLSSLGKSVSGKAIGMAAGAATFGAGAAVSAASQVRDAHTVAKAAGATGFMGKAKGMINAVSQARQEAKIGGQEKQLEQNPGSTRTQLSSQANAIRAQKAFTKGKGSN